MTAPSDAAIAARDALAHRPLCAGCGTQRVPWERQKTCSPACGALLARRSNRAACKRWEVRNPEYVRPSHLERNQRRHREREAARAMMLEAVATLHGTILSADAAVVAATSERQRLRAEAGATVRRLRVSAGQSLAILAAAAQVNIGDLSRLERGISWSQPCFEAVMTALGVSFPPSTTELLSAEP